MNHYLIEQAGSTQVLRSENPEPHWILIPDEAVEPVFAAMADNRPFRIVQGVLEVGEVKPDLASQHVWNWDAQAWQDPRTLADLKADKWAEVKQARETALAAPLVTPFGVFDADEKGSANIIKSVLLANNLAALGYPVAIDFTLADNTQVVLDAPAMVQVGLLLAGREQTIRAHATVLRGQIDAADSPEALETFAWNLA